MTTPKREDEEPPKAGNAIYDRSEQDCREDLPEGAQETCGEPRRGTAPGGGEQPRARVEGDAPSRAKGSPPVDEPPD